MQYCLDPIDTVILRKQLHAMLTLPANFEDLLQELGRVLRHGRPVPPRLGQVVDHLGDLGADHDDLDDIDIEVEVVRWLRP